MSRNGSCVPSKTAKCAHCQHARILCNFSDHYRRYRFAIECGIEGENYNAWMKELQIADGSKRSAKDASTPALSGPSGTKGKGKEVVDAFKESARRTTLRNPVPVPPIRRPEEQEGPPPKIRLDLGSRKRAAELQAADAGESSQVAGEALEDQPLAKRLRVEGEHEVQALKAQIQELHQEVARLKSENAQLQDAKANVDTELEQMSQAYFPLQEAMTELQTTVQGVYWELGALTEQGRALLPMSREEMPGGVVSLIQGIRQQRGIVDECVLKLRAAGQ